MSENQTSFFASLNTARGFQSDFESIFDPKELKQIYILKGGPGTGKSSLIRKIAEDAEKRGQTVERFRCSSDPQSLDGIILSEINIAILDGTAPHLMDADFPGIIETIINLGSFWDIKKLISNKQRIFELIKEKKNYYKSAYHFLEAFGDISEEILNFSKKHLLQEKMLRNINVQTGYFFQRQFSNAKKRIRNVSTICKDGAYQLRTFEHKSNRIWVIDDHCYSGHLYLEELKNIAEIKNQSYDISHSPIFPNKPNALFFPESKICFILGKRDYDNELPNKEYHYINMKRFLDLDKFAEAKQKIKFSFKCCNELLDGATYLLKSASNCHKELEEYYISAMDFKKVEALQNEISESIFNS